MMQNLWELVTQLRKEFDGHCRNVPSFESFRNNKSMVRDQLVFPLLEAMGWDLDRDCEFGIKHNRFSLHNGGLGNILIVETQEPEATLFDPDACVDKDERASAGRGPFLKRPLDMLSMLRLSDYFAVTDGCRWDIYDKGEHTISFNIRGPSVAEVCMKAMSLWKPVMISGHVPNQRQPVPVPVMELRTKVEELEAELKKVQASYESEQEKSEQLQKEVDDLEGENERLQEDNDNLQEKVDQHEEEKKRGKSWQPLATWDKPDKTWWMFNVKNHPKPTEILFPDRGIVHISHQYQILVEVVRWLVDSGKLEPRHCPVSCRGMRGNKTTIQKRKLIATSLSQAGTSTNFDRHVRIGPFYLETNHHGQEIIRQATHLIRLQGEDFTQVKLR